MNQANDEIDLQEMAVRVIRYFWNHLIFICVLCGLGIVLGVLAYRSLPKKYESQMVILSDLLTKTYGDRMSRSLEGLIKEENYNELGAKFGMPADRIKGLSWIEIECFPDPKSPQRENITKDETYFVVTVDVTDRSVLPELQDGMLNFFRNNELVKKHARQREALNTAVINKIDKELKSLDSLKQYIFQRGPFKTENLMFDPAAIFSSGVQLTKMRWESQQELEFANSIHLVEGFTAFEKPAEPKLSYMVIFGFSLGLFGAIGMLTLKHLFKLARG